MIKGEPQAEEDIYELIRDFFESRISGKVYKSETRPTDSEAEDAAIHGVSLSGGQFQAGGFTILVFTPDVDNGTGRLMPNKSRLVEFAGWAEELLQHMQGKTNEYALSHGANPISQGNYPGGKEHFVAMRYEMKRESI